MAAEDAEVFDGAVFGDGGGEGNGSGDAHGSGNWRIDRGSSAEDVALDDAAGDRDAAGYGRAHCGRRVSVEDAVRRTVCSLNSILDSIDVDEGGGRWGGVGFHSDGCGDDRRGCEWVAEGCGLDGNGLGGAGLWLGGGRWWRVESSTEKEGGKALGVNEGIGDQDCNYCEV